MSTTLQTTAILKTDIAGSTPRFLEMLEADLAVVLTEHRALVSRLAAAHDGRLVKPEGDGFWLAFPSVTAAALAAMSMQEELRLSQPNTGNDRLAMRIVITLGDVLHQEGALVGDAAWLAMSHAQIRTAFVDAFAVKGFVEPVPVYRIEQTHRTRVIADQYIVVTDLTGFTRLLETSGTTLVETILDGLHDAITEAARAMAGLEHLVAAWDAFVRKTDVRCPINVAVHKGTLNVAFGVESATQHVSPGEGIFVTGQVRRDLLGTPWEARLDPVRIEPMPARLEDTEIYRVRTA